MPARGVDASPHNQKPAVSMMTVISATPASLDTQSLA